MNRWHRELLQQIRIALDPDSGAGVDSFLAAMRLAIDEGVSVRDVALTVGFEEAEVEALTMRSTR